MHKNLRHNEATCTNDGHMNSGDTLLMRPSVFLVKWCVGLAFLRLLALNIYVSSVSPTQSRLFLHHAQLLASMVSIPLFVPVFGSQFGTPANWLWFLLSTHALDNASVWRRCPVVVHNVSFLSSSLYRCCATFLLGPILRSPIGITGKLRRLYNRIRVSNYDVNRLRNTKCPKLFVITCTVNPRLASVAYSPPWSGIVVGSRY